MTTAVQGRPAYVVASDSGADSPARGVPGGDVVELADSLR